MSDTLRWGILGTGNIAKQFCTGVRSSARGILRGVGSRSIDSARAFASQFEIPNAGGRYDEVLNDPSIDAVYVSLPNSMHHEWTIKALRAGKHVLCEKPLSPTVAEAQEMFDVSQKTGRLLIEAFMYRTHPQTLAVLEKVRAGKIGTVQMVRTSFCFRVRKVEGNIRFRPDLAGGVLADVGCYCVSLARLIAGCEPVAMQAFAHPHESGVEDIVVGSMRFSNGMLTSFTCGMSVQADNTAYICGDEGYIEIPVPWKPPVVGAKHIIARSTPPKMDSPGAGAITAPPREEYVVDAGRDLYGIEADAFAECVLDGRTPFVTRDDSIGNVAVISQLQKQIG